MIRVGKIHYVYGKKHYPHYDGYEVIEVMTPSTKYGSLGPYSLKVKVHINKNNDLSLAEEKKSEGETITAIMENAWQFAKWYPIVPYSKQRYSRYNSTVIWEHPKETHMKGGKGCFKPNQKYFAWRKKGLRAKYAIRYPVTFNPKIRASCIGALWQGKLLDYIEARKQIYFPLYKRAVEKEPLFQVLKRKLRSGKKLLIVEVDGPVQSSLPYYQEKYSVPKDFIVGSTVAVTEENIRILLNDPKHPFGHGYCLAMTLLDMKVE